MSSLPGVKGVDNQLVVTATPANAFSDEWIGERVRGMLLIHRSVSYINTDVSVKNSIVTLSGSATSEAQKELTTEYAKDVSGVKEVINTMDVSAAPGKSERLKSEKVDDASITTQVRLSLLYHNGTDGFDTKVSTYKGIVTLSGSAKNQAEIDLATKRVKDIYGVESVNNQMHVTISESSGE
jgi:osmotically-inducible protein OsmY